MREKPPDIEIAKALMIPVEYITGNTEYSGKQVAEAEQKAFQRKYGFIENIKAAQEEYQQGMELLHLRVHLKTKLENHNPDGRHYMFSSNNVRKVI
jgi:hypothetical protein